MERISVAEHRKMDILGGVEKELNERMLQKRYHKSKQLLDTYGNVYRGWANQRDLLQLMKQAAVVENSERERFDGELRHAFHAKFAQAKINQDRHIDVWRYKVELMR